MILVDLVNISNQRIPYGNKRAQIHILWAWFLFVVGVAVGVAVVVVAILAR